MNYKLVKATNKDIEFLKKSKLYNIFAYAHDITNMEKEVINNYVNKNIPLELNDYKLILVNNNLAGCLLVQPKDDGIILDEIFLEESYRNKGIGTNIIKNILEKNNIIYLWVYKENVNALKLYKRLNFKIIEETKNRYYMKYISE